MPSLDRGVGRRIILTLAVVVTASVLALPAGSPANAVTPSGPVATGASALDETGTTLPDTNYPVPTSGVVYLATNGSDANNGSTTAVPVLTLNRAISVVPSGGTIVVRAGVYRDWYHGTDGLTKNVYKGFTLQPYPHEKVWFDGSDVQPSTGWTSDGSGHWYRAWSTPQFCNGAYYDFAPNKQAYVAKDESGKEYAKTGNADLLVSGASGTKYSSNSGPCTHWDQYGKSSATYPSAGDPQSLFVNGLRMAQVDTLSAATGGKFFYDWTNRRIYLSTDPATSTVELSTRPNALVLGTAAAPYTLRGIGFRRYASNEYGNATGSAVYGGGQNPVTLENMVFTQNSGTGFSVGARKSTVTSSVFASNGFNGVGGNGHAGSSDRDDFRFIGNVFNNNNVEHFGLECTISCAAAGLKIAKTLGYTMSGNIFENNLDKSAGAWCDTACSDGVFVNNLVINNFYGYFYEQDFGGIVGSNLIVRNRKYGLNLSGTGTKVYNNTFDANAEVNVRLTDDPREGGTTTGSLTMVNNLVAGASVNDVLLGGGTAAGLSDPKGWFTASTFDHNGYWRATDFVLYRVINAQDTGSKSPTELRSKVGVDWEQHSYSAPVSTTDPFFTNRAQGDYTVRTNSPAYAKSTPIPDDVAAAIGVTPGSTPSLGAVSWPAA